MKPILPSLLLFSLPLASVLPAQTSAGGNALQVRLLSAESVVAPGKPFWVGVEVVQPQGWHSYWTNSGGIGMPTTLKFTLPTGATSGPIIWALPHVVDGGEAGMSYERSGTTMDLVEITPAANLPLGEEFEISVEVGSQLCNDQACLPPRSTKASLKLKTGLEAVADAARAAKLAPAKAAAPVTLPGWNVAVKGNTITVMPTAQTKRELGTLQYLNFTDDFEAKPVSITKEGAGWRITLKETTAGAAPVPAGVLIASKGWNAAGATALVVGNVR